MQKLKEESGNGAPLPDLRTYRDFTAPADAVTENGQSALMTVARLYETIRAGSWEDGVACMFGLYELLRHNPQFRTEAAAVRCIWEGAAALSAIHHRIDPAPDAQKDKVAA